MAMIYQIEMIGGSLWVGVGKGKRDLDLLLLEDDLLVGWGLVVMRWGEMGSIPL